MYICITEVDALTNIPCINEPQRNGPSMPKIKGLVLDWANKSTWPVEVASDGTYLRAPLYYGTCDDDADINVPGVLEVLTETEWMQRKHDEFYARKPYSSWTWDSESLTWNCPVPYPEGADFNAYRWDEDTLTWVNFNV